MGLLKVGRGSLGSYFSQLSVADGVNTKVNATGRCVELSGAPIITILSKTDNGELESGITEIPAQRRARLEFGQVIGNRCNPLIEINPLLYESASVEFERVLSEAGLQNITLYLNTRTKLDLAELPYLVRVYALD